MSSVEICLNAFLERYNQMKGTDQYGEDVFTKQFWDLRDQTMVYRTENTFPALEGQKDCNAKKNRYKDILPFDYTRVLLEEQTGRSGSDYINANFVKGATGRTAYIAAQGPLPQTVNDFWRMLWQYDVKIILMACKEYEGKKHKCQRYWANEGEELEFGNITVTQIEEKDNYHEDFRVRHLQVQCGSKLRSVYHFHYTAWPDHGTPTSPLPILDMISMARKFQSQDTPHILMHCSAGCGRTGTMIVIDYAWNILKFGRLTEEFDLYGIIENMRKQRISLVQSPEQYAFTHHAVAELYRRHLVILKENCYANVFDEEESNSHAVSSPTSAISSSSTYEDVSINGDGENHPTDQTILETMTDMLSVYGNVETKAPPKSPVPSPRHSLAEKSAEPGNELVTKNEQVIKNGKQGKPPLLQKPVHKESDSSSSSEQKQQAKHLKTNSPDESNSINCVNKGVKPKAKAPLPVPVLLAGHEYADIDDTAGTGELTSTAGKTQPVNSNEYADIDDANVDISLSKKKKVPTATLR